MARLFKHREEQKSLWQRIRDVAFTDVGAIVRGMDEGSLEAIEELLLANDFGVQATMRLVDRIEALWREGRIRTEEDFHRALEQEIFRILAGGDADTSLRFAEQDGPTVFLMLGVNGVGKTTTIAKIGHELRREGRTVLLAACDTFRAGAIQQLGVWAERVDAEFVGAQAGADPAAVAFDAVDAARARGADVVLVDTAGRLHTEGDLMGQLAKIGRVLGRKVGGAPHETLLVLDATVGQNALAQARTFHAALPLTGLVLAKLDGTAKGGIVVALKEELGLPVKLIGTGESTDALEPFDPERFAGEVLTA